MATFVKFHDFAEQLGRGVHQLHAAGHTVMVYLSNVQPSASTHTVKANIAGATEQNGYAAADIQNDLTETGGTATMSGVNVVWTATGAGFGPFRYAVLYNDTPTTPLADPLIGYWDYGSSISVLAGETFTVNFPGNVVMTIA
jgi:hypothetical protein